MELLQTENANLKKQINEILDASESAQLIQELRTQKMSLEFELSAMTQQRDDIFNALKELNQKYKAQQLNEPPMQQMKEIKVQNEALKAENEQLMADKKSMESKVMELRQQLRAITTVDLDRSRWRQWTPQQVFQFIMSTVNDGSLDQYRRCIGHEILESEYDGNVLDDITLDHVKAMGIKKISVRNKVLAAIRELVNEVKDDVKETVNGIQAVESVVDAKPTAYI